MTQAYPSPSQNPGHESAADQSAAENHDGLVHQTMAFYDDAVDSPDMNEMNAFDRLQASLVEAGADPPGQQQPPQPPPPQQPPDSRWAAVTQAIPGQQQPSTHNAAQPVEEEDEASIEDYMASLLQRVNGGTLPPAANTAPGLLRPKSGETAPGQPQSGQQNAPAAPREVKPPPESREGLSSMRELANMTARNAIDTHANRQITKPLGAKLTVAASALAVSIVSAVTAPGILSLEFVTSITTLVVAGVYCRQVFAIAKMSAAAAQTESSQAAQLAP